MSSDTRNRTFLAPAGAWDGGGGACVGRAGATEGAGEGATKEAGAYRMPRLALIEVGVVEEAGKPCAHHLIVHDFVVVQFRLDRPL